MARICKMGERVVVYQGSKEVASAQNLEVLSRYHRQYPVKRSSIKKLPAGKGLLYVKFSNGAQCRVVFASYAILKDWLKTKRQRSGWA